MAVGETTFSLAESILTETLDSDDFIVLIALFCKILKKSW